MKSDIDYIQLIGKRLIANERLDHLKDIDNARKLILLQLISMVGVVTLIVMGTVSFFNNSNDMVLLDYFVALILLFNIIFMKKTGNYRVAAVNGTTIIGILFLYLFITGGDNNTGYLWYFTFPLFSFFLLGSKKGIYATVILFLLSFIFLLINPLIPAFVEYPKNYSIRIVAVYMVVAVFSYLMEVTRENAHKKLTEKNIKLNEAITELKKTEERLREAGEKLESRVKERTIELIKVNKVLLKEIEDRKQAESARKSMEVELLRAQKMEAVGTLAGGVAHDLNNILAGIVGYPELILMDLPADSPIKKPITTIKKSGEKAAAIVEDLLTLSRRNISVKEPVLIDVVINDYLDSPEYERLIKYHPGVKVSTFLNSATNIIEGSPIHISKTIMNLVSNAAEAMPDGGDITIATKIVNIKKNSNGHVELNEGKHLKLEVSDTGEGIPEEDINRIFEPFFSKKVMGRSGTGLGMAVVWGTVQDHDGIIDIKSEIGKGTTFTLYFPVTSEEKQHIPKKDLDTIKDHLVGNGESILIVDDVKEQREVATELLKKLGYNVKSVSSGEKAIDYLKSADADLILLDMIMGPGIDGFDTLQKIRKIKHNQKVIITSGYSETRRVRECINMGICRYLKKPFTLAGIGISVKKILTE